MKMCGKLYALVLAVVVFVSVSGNAAPVDRGLARAIAMTVLPSDAQALESRMLSDAPEQGNPPYYVFTEKGGRFVIAVVIAG
ncbi:MAG: hypothetical protein IJY31_00855 [Muribaculaceae bacterium]|nr:hypothetical protein [Muribaculaceae bacterium]